MSNFLKFSFLLLFAVLFNIMAMPVKTAQQGMTITGTVTDESGAPLPGVNVVVKGTAQGSVTGANGEYSIQAPDGNAVLVFSFVGFATQEIAVGNRQIIVVTLSEDATQMDEVVVVGYSVQRRLQLTGAMVAIGESKLRTETTPRMENMLNLPEWIFLGGNIPPR